MYQLFQSRKYNSIFWICFSFYILFVCVLVFRSSFIGSDGQRHVALFDDAMISLRYGYNLVHGNGLVFNIGEKVEGFTNPLMVFVMAGAIGLFGKFGAIVAIQVLGVLLLSVNILLVYLLTKRFLGNDKDDFLLLLPLLLTMCWYPISYWAIFGMETGLLTTFILLSVYVSERPNSKLNSLLFGAILAACYLTRPESLIFIGIFFAFRFLKNLQSIKSFVNFVLEVLVCVIPIMAYQFFRLKYYGQNYPNTYVLKAVGMSLENKVKNGLGYYEPFLHRVEFFIGILLLFFFLYVASSEVRVSEKIHQLLRGKYAYVTFASTLFVVYAAYQVWVGGDPWPPFWRMTVPYVTLSFVALPIVGRALKNMLHIKDDIFYGLIALVVFTFIVFIPFDYHFDFLRVQPYQTLNNQVNVDQALAISELTDPQATIATFWAGSIPYYTERYTYDPLGKMDPYIAHLPPDLSGVLSNRGMFSIPGHNKYDLNYSLLTKQPDVIVYLSFADSYCAWAKQNLEAWCKDNYRLVTYKGAQLLLKNNSNHVMWNKIQ